MEHPVVNRSIEYNDNRIALFSGQGGKCRVTGEELIPTNIHCHHILPLKYGGKDEYKNLCLVDKEIHILIHATEDETINKYKKLITNKRSLDKLNTLRVKAKLDKLNLQV